MHRARVLVTLIVLLFAAVVASAPADAALSSPQAGLAATFLDAASSWEPWTVLRQWFGGVRVDCGGSADPYGQCASAAPGAGHPEARAPQPRPSLRPASGRSRFRVDCGGSANPFGGCASATPGAGSQAGHGM